MSRVLALCADDYGQSDAVCAGVLRLARRARLTEVSCMVNGRAWPTQAQALATLPGLAQGTLRAGLHFNLTEGRPLSGALAALWPQLPPLPQLMALAHLRRLPMAALRAELQAQFEAFEQATGRAADHLDGHQHVHHLPGVRALVLAQAASRASLRVRDTGQVRGSGHALKRWLIEATGGRRLRAALRQQRRQANTQLLGVYDFRGTAYRALMQQWLAALPERGALIFCHPGEAAPAAVGAPGATATGSPADPIAAARVLELAYLDSDDFMQDLGDAGVTLGPAA